MSDDVKPELFVARDRARRFHRRISDARSERRLSYKGASVGMETLVDRADRNLKSVVEDIGQTVEDIEAGRIRDRERGYMEMPLVVMAEGVADRVERARELERRRKSRKVGDAEAQMAVIALLDDTLSRIDAYCAAYDDKQPVGPPALTDLGRLLDRVERDRGFLHPPRLGETAPPPYDRAPPMVRTDAHVLEDLLRAARAATPGASQWRVVAAKPGQPLELALGDGEGCVATEPPERLRHAIAVLSHLQPLEVRCLARTPAPVEDDVATGADAGLLSEPESVPEADPLELPLDAVQVMLADDAAGRLETVLFGCAGPDARLVPSAEKAVRALLDAPPLTDGAAAPPPQRSIAWMGLLKAVDEEVARTLLPRAKTPASRVQASQLPREATRKAPPRRDLLTAIEQAFEDFPTQRVGDVARQVADRKLGAKLPALDAAALLAVVGRTWRFGGQDRRRAMNLDPLDNAEVEALMQDLADHASVRKGLETGQAVDEVGFTRFERASIAILGRLGRLD